MSIILDEIRYANNHYTQTFGYKGKLGASPSKKVAILTCMDARLDPAKYAGFREGEAHIIRNAGGRASDDAIRSLVISHKLLGTNQWLVIHHTDCGMESITDEIISNLLSRSLETAIFDSVGWKNVTENQGSDEGKYINWLTIRNQKDSIIEDVKRIRNHPLVSSAINIYGFIYDVKSGKLIEIHEANEVGKQVENLEAQYRS
jgi:carbonic anhydrase